MSLSAHNLCKMRAPFTVTIPYDPKGLFREKKGDVDLTITGFQINRADNTTKIGVALSGQKYVISLEDWDKYVAPYANVKSTLMGGGHCPRFGKMTKK